MLQTPTSSKIALNTNWLEHPLRCVKPKYHRYPCWLIAMSLDLLDRMPISSRLVVKFLEILSRYLPGVSNIPVHGTIYNWHNKSNYHQLMCASQGCVVPEDEQDEWCLIIDESISFGGQRILLVVGVRLRDYSQGLPLSYGDVKVLSVGLQYRSWKAGDIRKLLNREVLAYYSIAYVVSDGGASIVKAVADLDLARIEDCSHSFALLLKGVYANNQAYQDFETACTLLKRQGSISRYADIIPPKVRSHSRFMNIAPLIKWAVEKLAWLDEPTDLKGHSAKLTPLKRSKLIWLLDFRELIQQLDTTVDVLNTILRGLKREGVSVQTKNWVDDWLKKPTARRMIHLDIRLGVAKYMERQLSVVNQIGRSWAICSSDIAESLFGRHKYHRYGPARHGPAYMKIVGYGQKVKCLEVVINAMETTSNRSLNAWVKKKIEQARDD